MIRDLLKETQPIVYHALDHAVREDRISSAWLFSGPSGTPKYEAAILLAQSIFCESGGQLACETCNTCRRVKEGLYTDLLILDGRENTISKEMVDSLQERFSKTAVEKNGQRVYIIRNCENATVAAQNSMLKFLEEPGDGITAILITDNINRMLPTILSRCTLLPFVPMPAERLCRAAVEKGFDEKDAVLVSHFVKNEEDLEKVWDEKKNAPSALYQHIILMVKQFLNTDGETRLYLSADFESSYLSSLKDTAKAKKENLFLLSGFYEVLMWYCRCVLKGAKEGPLWFEKAVEQCRYDTKQLTQLLSILDEQQDACNKYYDLGLVFYQTLFRVEEYRL